MEVTVPDVMTECSADAAQTSLPTAFLAVCRKRINLATCSAPTQGLGNTSAHPHGPLENPCRSLPRSSSSPALF